MTYTIADIALLLVALVIMCAGCQQEPDTINWTAGDGVAHYR
jgi:hypothetical protein